MVAVNEARTNDAVSEAVRAIVLVVGGAPDPTGLVTSLTRDAIDVELRTFHRSGGEEATPPPDRSIVVVWLPGGLEPAVLADIVAWRDTASVPVRLLGYAPDGDVADSERALATGFDDFMAGRQSPRELSARLRALTRRMRLAVVRPADRIRFGRLVLDASRHELWIDSRRVQVTAMEMAILAALMQAGGRTLSRAELLDQVWGEDELDVGLRAVDNLVCRLRRKLGDPRLLVTVRGVGFRVADR